MKYITLFLVLILTGCTTTITSPDVEPEKNNMQQTSDASPKEGELLSSKDQQWIDQSCSRSLGPSLWSSCVQRETAALKSGVPDISKLSIENQNWIQSSCSWSLGPNLAIRCIQREKAAIESGMPDISQLTKSQKTWLSQSCSKSLGPSLFRACMNRESSALAGADSLRTQTPSQTDKSAQEDSYEKQWNCRALFGDEVVVKLAFNGKGGFVTMLDQEYEGKYDTEGTTRIWYFGGSENSELYRYSIELNARSIAYLFDFSDVKKDGSIESQETLFCNLN
jgi:hypothetical protein